MTKRGEDSLFKFKAEIAEGKKKYLSESYAFGTRRDKDAPSYRKKRD